MNFNCRSSSYGTLAVLATLMATTIPTVSAETVTTINGVDVDSSVVDTYIESRFQKPAMQATAEERSLVEQELTDIYLLTTQPSAERFAEDPSIKAQIELQYRGTIAQAVARDFIESNPATEEEISRETGIDRSKLDDARRPFSTTMCSLDESIPSSNSYSYRYIDIIEDEESENPFEAAMLKMWSGNLEEHLEVLTPKERTVISLRFGLNDAEEMTLEQVLEAHYDAIGGLETLKAVDSMRCAPGSTNLLK